jgi:hypothetical protein
MAATPPSTKAVSFRSQLLGDISDFLRDEKMACDVTCQSLVEFVVSLSRYREEGVALYPQVFLCDNLSEMLRVVQGREYVELGTGPRDTAVARRALKVCAPLARLGWAVYIHRQEGSFSYGVFRVETLPMSLSPVDGLLVAGEHPFPVLMAVQLAENVVELRASSGRTLDIYLTDARTERDSPRTSIDDLVSAICSSVAVEHKEQAIGFFRNTLFGILQESHGALVAIVDSSSPTPALLTDDGVQLGPPVDVVGRIADYKLQGGTDAFAALQGAAVLIRGMMASDGITVFGNNGTVIAFNVFVKHEVAVGRPPVGGARRRAFEVLKGAVGHGLVAAYYRSQDGRSECERRQ